ncbi:MAG: hypothetical protein ACE5J7_03640 [Candidatus Aenigmatarchaeota archaeon]
MTGSGGCELNFFNCPFRDTDLCRPDDELPKCTYGLTKAIDEDGDRYITDRALDLLKEDTYTEGYSLQGIEEYILLLNHRVDWMVEYEGRETEDLIKLTRKWKYEPLPIPMKDDYKKYHLRGSEFSGGTFEEVKDNDQWSTRKCDMFRIFTKTDQTKLGYLQNDLAIKGTTGHTFLNGQHVDDMIENQRLKIDGIDSMDRRKYCERLLEKTFVIDGMEYVLSGHADAVLKFINMETGEVEPVIFDQKRKKYSMYEEWGTKFQMSVYALAVIEQLGLDCEHFQVISAKRPRDPQKGGDRPLELHITRVEFDEGEVVGNLEKEITRTANVQRRILDDRNFYQKVKDSMLEAGKCGDCFNLQICEDAARELHGNEMTMRQLLREKWDAIEEDTALP